MSYWSQETMNQYFMSFRTKISENRANDKLRSTILSIQNLMTGAAEGNLRTSIRTFAHYIGAELVIIEKDVESLLAEAAKQIGFDPKGSLTKENEKDGRYFIDNKGFFVVHSVSQKHEVEAFAFGLLFKVLDVQSLEALDLVSNLSIQYLGALDSVRKSADLLTQTKVLSEKAELAAQVSHDIRSPLTALNMVSSTLLDIPEEKRLLIRHAVQRINDIANDLLSRGKRSTRAIENDRSLSPKESVLLSSLIDTLVSEKRTQFRDQINVSIDCDLRNSFGSFVELDPKGLSRVISNLINNSVEALGDRKGQVVVTVWVEERSVHIEIKDNGCGIPTEILDRLGKPGVSHGKQNTSSGSGLGIYHAKKTILSMNGKLNINSHQDVGTTVEIELPRANAPGWFLSEINIPHGAEIICLDDDIAIHQVWKERLNLLSLLYEPIGFRSFTSAVKLEEHIRNQSRIIDDIKPIYLIDYELLNQNTNGLELIKSLNLQQNAVLVTSRHENLNLQTACLNENIKILPKSLAEIVPLITPNITIETSELIKMSQVDVVPAAKSASGRV